MKYATLLASSLIGAANAHYWIKNIDGQTDCLRPLVQYQENFPVTGDDIAVSVAADPAPGTCTYAAGSTMTAVYDGAVGHPGPCHVHVSSDGGKTWALIWEDNKATGAANDQWCNNRFTNGQTTLTYKIPSQLPSGKYVFRIEHLGLHGAGAVGGAQFYVRCADINITNGGSQAPAPAVAFPGTYYTTSTPGILWNPYTGNNANYPDYGPALAYSGSTGGGSGGNPSTTTRQTTTTRQQQTTTTTTRQQQTSTTTQPPRTTTTTVAPPTGNCAQKYGQCGM
uniref:lytic cellulose monooxygenase (C4-dehydrogenating) n=1 Tax=Rhizophlyctis rosea TaxID=64517 RepID=A0A2U8U9P5_9FUNG|nr:lytic polysaccharide monooxygenase 9 [Rhizophlyctis rosea]